MFLNSATKVNEIDDHPRSSTVPKYGGVDHIKIRIMITRTTSMKISEYESNELELELKRRHNLSTQSPEDTMSQIDFAIQLLIW